MLLRLTILLLLVASPTLAQEKKPGSIFDKDIFTNQAQRSNTKSSTTKVEQRLKGLYTSPKAKKSTKSALKSPSSFGNLESTSSSSSWVARSTKGRQGFTTRVTLLLNGNDTAHIRKALQEAKRLQKMHLIYLEKVVIHGVRSLNQPNTSKKRSPQSPMQLTQGLGLKDQQFALSKPNSTKARFSPAWIVSLPQGTITFDGYHSIRSQLNQNGGLLPRLVEQIKQQPQGVVLQKNNRIPLYSKKKNSTGTNSPWSLIARSSKKPPSLTYAQQIGNDYLPECRRSEKILVERRFDSGSVGASEVVYYDPNKKKPSKSTTYRSVAYIQPDTVDKGNPIDQQFAAFFRINCLPTRAQVVSRGKYYELWHYTGRNAWQRRETKAKN